MLGEDERHVGVTEDGVALLNIRAVILANEYHLVDSVIAAATHTLNVMALA